MTLLAVKKAKDTLNKQGLPLEWPAHCKEIDESQIDQYPEPWMILTPHELEQKKIALQDVYDEYSRNEKEKEKKSNWESNRAESYPKHKQLTEALYALMGYLLESTNWVPDAKAAKWISEVEKAITDNPGPEDVS